MIAMLAKTVAKIEADIEALKAYFAVPAIDDQPFVVVPEENVDAPTALRVIAANAFNATATGLDATTFTKDQANKIAAMYNMKAVPKYQFYKQALAAKLDTLKTINTLIA